MTEDQSKLIEQEIRKFVTQLFLNKDLKGVAIQLALSKPPTANDFVTSLFIGSSSNDTKAAVKQLELKDESIGETIANDIRSMAENHLSKVQR